MKREEGKKPFCPRGKKIIACFKRWKKIKVQVNAHGTVNGEESDIVKCSIARCAMVE